MNTATDLEQFTQACIEALYFTDTGEDEQPSKDAELSPETRLDLEADCRSWWRRFGCYVMADGCTCSRDGNTTKAAQAGHDFWMTRNHQGVGFWDGDWNATYSDMFCEGSEAYGEFSTCAGDDGMIYS